MLCLLQWLTIAIISKPFAGNQGNHQNFVPFLESHKLLLIWIGMKRQKKIKMANTKNWDFQLLQFSIFGEKMLRIELSFFMSAIFFCFIPFQISHNLSDSKDGTKFWWLSWFPAISSEMINIVRHCNKHNIGRGSGVSLFDF